MVSFRMNPTKPHLLREASSFQSPAVPPPSSAQSCHLGREVPCQVHQGRAGARIAVTLELAPIPVLSV